jgi:hypothetical protein
MLRYLPNNTPKAVTNHERNIRYASTLPKKKTPKAVTSHECNIRYASTFTEKHGLLRGFFRSFLTLPSHPNKTSHFKIKLDTISTPLNQLPRISVIECNSGTYNDFFYQQTTK